MGDNPTVSIQWLRRLPPFVSAALVAQYFDTTITRAKRWMGGPDSPLPRAKRPDNQVVTAREYVVKLALSMYGEMGQNVTVDGFWDEELRPADGPEGVRGDGLDRPRNNGTQFF